MRSLDTSLVVTPIVSGDELLRRLFAVIEEESRINPRLRRNLVRALCCIAVSVPAEDDDGKKSSRGYEPW